MTSPFICESMSSNCGAGSVDSVRDIASGQVRLGGRSTPGGRGGSVLECGGCASSCPFVGCGVYPAGAASPAPLSFDQSTRSFRPITS